MAVPAWYSNHMKPIDAFTLPYIVSSPDRLKASLDGTLGKEVSAWVTPPGSTSSATG